MVVPCPICKEPNEAAASGGQVVCSLCGTAYEPDSPRLLEDGGYDLISDDDDTVLAQPTPGFSAVNAGAEEVDHGLVNAPTAVSKAPSREELARLVAGQDASMDDDTSGDADDFSSAATVIAKIPTPEEIACLSKMDDTAATVISRAPTPEEIAAAVAADETKRAEGPAGVSDPDLLAYEGTPTGETLDREDTTSAWGGALGQRARRLSIDLGWTAEEEEIANDPHHFYRIPSAVAVDYSFYSHSEADMADEVRTGISRDLNDTGLVLRVGRLPDALKAQLEHDLSDFGMRLEIDLGDRTVVAQGAPQWRKDLPRGRMLIGVEFVDVHPGDAEAVREFARLQSMKPKVTVGVLAVLGVLVAFFALFGRFGSGDLEVLGESLEQTTEQLGSANAQLKTAQQRYTETAAKLDARTTEFETLAGEVRELAVGFRQSAALAGVETDEPESSVANAPTYQELTARIEELKMLNEALREQLEDFQLKRRKGKRRKRK